MASTTDYILDFKKEEKPEGSARVKIGTYKVRIGKPKIRRASTGNIGLSIPLTILEGKYKRKKITESLWMSPKAFHRYRELLEACGKKVPPGRADIRKIGRAVEGEEIYIQVVDDEQEGYATKSVVAFQGGFISPDDYEDDTDEGDEDDDEEGDELDDEDEEDADDDLDDDDEDDEPTPRRKAKASTRRATAKRKARKSADDEDDDLDSLGLDDFGD